MVSVENLKIGIVYRDESTLFRKIVGFYKVKMGRGIVSVKKSTDANTVKYIRIDHERNEIGDMVSCEISTFTRWAEETLSE